jgi:hypothetical protein
MDGRVTRRLALLLAPVALAACSVVPADPSRQSGNPSPEFPAPSDWPARDVTLDPTSTTGRPDWVIPCGPTGQGFLYRLDLPPDPDEPGYHVDHLVFLSCAEPASAEGDTTLTCDAGTWPLPYATNTMSAQVVRRTDRPLVGTCVYLASLVGVTDQERPFVLMMAERGWRLIILWPSVETYEGAFFALKLDADDDANASILAQSEDSYLAGAAYAAEAAIRWTGAKDYHPEDLPLIVVGCSMGALSAPSVAARIRTAVPSRLDAVVLVGGGTGLLRLTAASPVMRGRFKLLGIQPDLDGKGRHKVVAYDAAHADALLERATEVSRLDPAFTAASLRDVPVLLLHATGDQIVPSASGDDLYERLGRPERWCYPFGHTGLFLALPFEADDIVRWISAQVAAGKPPPAALQ